MRILNKLFAAGFILILSINSQAWELNENGVGFETEKSKSALFAVLEVHGEKAYVAIYDGSNLFQNCGAGMIKTINGVSVRMLSKESGVMCMFYPESDKGMEYLVNEFKNKTQVKIGSYTFSTLGFTETIQDIINLEASAI